MLEKPLQRRVSRRVDRLTSTSGICETEKLGNLRARIVTIEYSTGIIPVQITLKERVRTQKLKFRRLVRKGSD